MLRVYPGQMPTAPPILPGALRDPAGLAMERPRETDRLLFKGDVSARSTWPSIPSGGVGTGSLGH